MTFADWKAGARPERVPVDVCFDREAITTLYAKLDQFGSLKQQAQGKLDEPEDVAAAAERIKQLDAKVAEATKTLWFTKIANHEWTDLEDAHPATDEQVEAEPAQKLNPDTFEPAIVAACCVEPGLTVDEAAWLRDFLPRDSWDEVLAGVFQANQTGLSVPKGVSGIADRLLTELKSISPADPESPSLSSEDGE